MYNKFHKGELIKSETTIDSTFPANREIELWKNTELKRFEVLERPVISLFENDVEHERFVQDLIKGLYLGRDIDDSKNFNSILYGCELDKETLTNGDVYTTLTPGIFIYENKVYQIYPTCYIASRQLEKEAELTTENGLEYINIKYENEKFSADIKVGSYPKEKISGDITRGIVLLEKIKTYLDGKIAYRHSGHEVPEVINISTSLEKFQLEPVFKSTTKRWVRFDHQNKEIQNGNKGLGEFLFGGHSSDGALDFKDIVKWDGFITRAYKENSITNDKLAKIPTMTVKGNDTGGEHEVIDITRDNLVNTFKLASWDDDQTIDSIKTFTKDQVIDQSKKLIFKKNKESYGWNINKNGSDSLIIEKGGATPKTILAIEDDEDIIFNVKDFTITSTNTNITGKTNITGDTNITGNLEVSSNADISGDLNVAGSTAITGKTTLEDELEVTGATDLKSTLDVTGKTALKNKLEVTEATDLKSTLDVAEKATLKNKLEVSGTTLLKDDLTVSAGKDTTLGGELSVTGNASITGTLGVTGATSLSTLGTSGLATLNSLSVTNNTSLGGTLGVTGDTSLFTLGTSGLATLNTLGVTGATTLTGALGVAGATTLSSTLEVTGATSLSTLGTGGLATLNSLKVTGASTLEGNLTIGNNNLVVVSSNGNTTIGGTLGVTGLITATAGLSSSGDIQTINSKDIKSTGKVEAVGNILSTSGTFSLNKRNFTINLGNSSGSTYDWVIKKDSSSGTGTLEIVGGGKTTSIDNSGLLKAEGFATNTADTLNTLNVNKFNGHTITTSSSSEEMVLSNVNDMILWKSPGASGTIIKKVAFKKLPKADEDTGEDGLMTAENLGRITSLETYAGWAEGDGTFLIGEVNGEKASIGGGPVSIDSKIINIDDSEAVAPGTSKETIYTRLSENATELTRLAGHLPATDVASGSKQVLLKDGTTATWGQITDSQINSTITKIAPFSGSGGINNVTRNLSSGEYPVTLWNTTGTTLASKTLQHNDIVYTPSSNTLTATNVTSRSSRKLKKDIETYTESAFNTLDKIEVVSFHFIDDETQADKVGFIAEDSPSLVAGLNHDKMDMNNCIGLLIKAVQELREENKELRNELNNIRNS